MWKSWQRRYFILDSHGELYYYKSPREKPINSFRVSSYKDDEHWLRESSMGNGGQFGILMSTAERNWKFVCENERERKSWMKAFKKAKKAASVNRDRDHNIEKRKVRGSIYDLEAAHKASPTHKPAPIQMNDADLKKGMKTIIKLKGLSDKEIAAIERLDHDNKMKLVSSGLQTPDLTAQSTLLESKTSLALDEDAMESPYANVGRMPSRDLVLGGTTHSSHSMQALTDRSSLLMKSQALKRQHETTLASPFGAKHRDIIKVLLDAVRTAHGSEQRLTADKDIMECILSEFIDNDPTIFTPKAMDTEMDEMESTTSVLSQPRSLEYKPISSAMIGDAASRANDDDLEIEFKAPDDAQSASARFVCRSVEGISFDLVVDVIEFMLEEMWKGDAAQTLYGLLVRSMVPMHWKCKMFAVGIERKDRMRKLTKFKHCFVGAEGIDFVLRLQFVSDRKLMNGQKDVGQRERAMDLLNVWVTSGLIVHVTGHHKMKDSEELFYEVNDKVLNQRCAVV